MVNNAVYSAYSQNQIGVESQEKLIEMLYGGVLRFASRIKLAIQNENIEERVYYVKRTSAIFIELINCLDYDRGGEVAHYLSGLYTRQLQLLSLSNIENNEARVDEVINVVKGLLEAWREVHQK
ncbi:flagellar export chaperone FliS [Campylobacter insulaenigrae]|uniref:Flagellar protein FliS n=2 Tax=Campylobacter insulaenigrae TaxID=260714 RepID=A0A0A8H0Z2_9BACT|nr:flagellar export chaperone FliS [Campylobacter insulaenigrae]AJC87706.1 flagellar protein FliS [Campylobacter insulaenigrae NCTC 12927]MCR6570097.1 flagellar export chaperone FliS [Campylobacter insulaenigrae]MCR6571882.1 flagellar export chaperone FliS [Campylobacter insulaenigrae]MCR6573140.1 flagellar export chaperone FliS [Campylobacter insulaenigrae]MCR6574927.1 flagellar export chaperone FliS [Campylobacter insulaenigrae]